MPWVEILAKGWERPLLMASIYMPQRGRAKYQVEVQACLQAILPVVLDARSRGCYIALLGDFNLSHLAEQVSHNAPRGASAQRFEAEFEALHTLFHIMQRGHLRTCEPEGGFKHAFIPCAHHLQPSCLDDCLLDHASLGHIRGLTVDADATARADHLPLVPVLSATSTRRRGNHFRRKWLGWSERSEGQLSELLREDAWRDVGT